ncbi:MAG TPA: MBL fold metallo-hydrolase, partial [Desulfomonilia bacterium]|nr:MBL fold metallo-hydrolase [Desulfomonilia bacterium]
GHDIIKKICAEVPIDRAYLSHSHLDHTSGSRLLQDSFNTEIMVPEENSDTIATAELLALRFVGEQLFTAWMETYPPLTGFENFTVTSTFNQELEFSTGSLRFLALYCPGHLNDHYCFWVPDKKILLGFDIDLSPFGPWYGNPECDISLFKNSLAEMMEIPAEVYLSSHARPLRKPYIMKRLQSYSAFFEERDCQIMGLLSQAPPMGIDDLVRVSPFYDADHASVSDELLWFGEEQMIRKHLEGLIEKELVVQEGELFRISDKR